jgi:hypothetical protein
VNNDLSAWATLSGEYKIDLFCVYFGSKANEVVQASAETFKILGDRGVALGLRIYSSAEEDGDYEVAARRNTFSRVTKLRVPADRR